MKITKRWLKKHNACKEGIDWFKAKNLTSIEHKELIKMLVEEGKIGWIWLLSHLLKGRSLVDFGCYCARLVLPIWEAEYPDNSTVRLCIEVAENPESTREELREAAKAAYRTARAAYWTARAAYWAAYAAYRAACCAGASATSAASWAVSQVAEDSYWAAKAAVWDVVEIEQKMIDKALELIEQPEVK